MPDTLLFTVGLAPIDAGSVQVTPAGASSPVALSSVINGGTVAQTFPSGSTLPAPLIGGVPSESIVNAITASTTQTVAGATALTGAINVVSTVANAGDAVKLPALQINSGFAQVVRVINNGASACSVFANETTTAIDTHATNTAATLTTLHRADFMQNTASTWVSMASVSAAS